MISSLQTAMRKNIIRTFLLPNVTKLILFKLSRVTLKRKHGYLFNEEIKGDPLNFFLYKHSWRSHEKQQQQQRSYF